MIFLSAQPDSFYFTWHAKCHNTSVTLYNFFIKTTLFFSKETAQIRAVDPYVKTVSVVFKVNKQTFAVEKYIAYIDCIINGVNRSKFRYESYKSIGNKYYVDSFYYLHPRYFKKRPQFHFLQDDPRGLIIRINDTPQLYIYKGLPDSRSLIDIDNRQFDLKNIKPLYFENFCKIVPELTAEMRSEWDVHNKILLQLYEEFENYLNLFDEIKNQEL